MIIYAGYMRPSTNIPNELNQLAPLSPTSDHSPVVDHVDFKSESPLLPHDTHDDEPPFLLLGQWLGGTPTAQPDPQSPQSPQSGPYVQFGCESPLMSVGQSPADDPSKDQPRRTELHLLSPFSPVTVPITRLDYPTLPYPTLPYLTFPTLPYPTLLYSTLPYPTLPYTLPYPVGVH